MSVFRAMSRKEIVITITILFLNLILVVYGARLVMNFASGFYEPPPERQEPLTGNEVSPVQLSSSPLVALERSFFQHCQLAHQTACKDLIAAYCLLTATVVLVSAVIWRKHIYLPARFTCVTVERLNELVRMESMSGLPRPHHPHHPHRHKPC